MQCSEIISKLEELSPIQFAEKWDNVGLLVGRRNKEVRKVCLAVDATEDVLEQAILEQVDLLITHHPLIFSKLKQIDADDFVGKRIINLIQNDISYYAMHTNFDVMGMADAAADELGLKNAEVLDIMYEDEISKEGCGRIGILPHMMALEECAKLVKTKFAIEHVRVYGEPEKTIEKVAILPGSGGDYLKQAISFGADVMITGDIKYHEALDALAEGMAIIDGGHFELEKIFVPYMKEYLERELPEIEVYAPIQENPFWIV